MSAQHTPGPWTWMRNDACAQGLKGAFVRAATIAPGGRYPELALVSAREVGDQAICDANACLMAAAPDLLEALRRYVARHEALNASITHTVRDASDLQLESARAVIAKATGSTA